MEIQNRQDNKGRYVRHDEHDKKANDRQIQHLLVIPLVLVRVGRGEHREDGVEQARALLGRVDGHGLELGDGARGADGVRRKVAGGEVVRLERRI